MTVHDSYGREIPSGTGPYRTLRQIKKANKAAGKFYFEADTLRFFDSKPEPEIYAGRFFLDSIQPPDGPRLYTVCVAYDNGDVCCLHDAMKGTPDHDEAVARALVAASKVMGLVTS